MRRATGSLWSLLMFLGVSSGLAGVKDYVALMKDDPNLAVRWDMSSADPCPNSATGVLAPDYPGLKKWMRQSPDPEVRDNGFSGNSRAVLTGCLSPQDDIAAAFETTGPVRYFPETTIEMVFSPQELPKGSDSPVYLGWRWSPEGRISPLVFQPETGAFASIVGKGSPTDAVVPWDLVPKKSHWYYVAIQLQFVGDDRVELSAWAADLTAGETTMRQVAGPAGRPIATAHFLEKGSPMRIGIGGSLGQKQTPRSAPTLFDEIAISKGLLTAEQMNERLKALLQS